MFSSIFYPIEIISSEYLAFGVLSLPHTESRVKAPTRPEMCIRDSTYVDENVKERVRDAAGAMVRATITDYFTAKEQHHRMTQEFLDFAKIIDEKDYETCLLYTSYLINSIIFLCQFR